MLTQHYYMLDFCYMANALLLAHCLLAPRNVALSKVRGGGTWGGEVGGGGRARGTLHL